MNKYARHPEYILDLHGFTTKQAKSLLDAIVTPQKYKHIRLITGKGTLRETGPVMKSFVQNYLNNLGVVFEVAKLYNGGEGALEVYL